MSPSDTKRAFFWGRLSLGLAGAALALLSLALVIPWVSVIVTAADGSQTITISYFVIGFFIQACVGAASPCSAESQSSGIWLRYVGDPSYNPDLQALYSGLASGLGLVAVAHMLAVAGVCLSARAFRLLHGGRAACCAGCACTGCGRGGGGGGGAARVARARCSAMAATGLLIVPAIAAAAAAGAAGAGSSAIIADYLKITLFSVRAATGGIGMAAFACVVAAAAAGVAGVFIRRVILDDVKGSGDTPTSTVVINALQMHALPTPTQAA